MTFLLLPPYLVVAIIVIWKVLKRVEGKRKKWGVFFLLMLAFYLPLGWDVILGRAYFYHLCETQGGVHVYKNVELEAKYFDIDKAPLFYDKEKSIGEMDLATRYVGRTRYDESFSKFLNIDKSADEILDTKSGEVLGRATYFLYFGGWFVNHAGFHVSGERCPSSRLSSSYLEELSKNVFRRMEIN